MRTSMRQAVWKRATALMLTVVVGLVVDAHPSAEAASPTADLIRDRNLGNARPGATLYPRSEGDQALVDGWPMYRTERAQTAFNDVMATLRATDTTPPSRQAFKGCVNLECGLSLPAIGREGWLPPGRLWVSPNEYVLIVHSPRFGSARSYRLRMRTDMRYFVYHEFQNSSRNTDVFDTISAHKGSVFVPLYMSKTGTDARGNRYVTVVQVAPYNVQSIHASNYGSAGPGMEVAKNASDELQPMQALAGILIGTIVKAAAPQLHVVSHHGVEGRPMLEAYERRLALLQSRPDAAALTLPFTPAEPARIASASAPLQEIIQRPGLSPRIPIAQRGFLPPRAPAAIAPPAAPVVTVAAMQVPTPSPALSPLAAYLRAHLNTMRQQAAFARFIPSAVASIGVSATDTNVVYLLDVRDQIIGRIEPHRENGREMVGLFVAAPSARGGTPSEPFRLDLTRPPLLQSAAWAPSAEAPSSAPLLREATQPATRPACASARASYAGSGCR